LLGEAESFHTQLKRKVQHVGESLQEFAAVIDHLAHHVFVDSTIGKRPLHLQKDKRDLGQQVGTEDY
jgi:hypothetical protein